MSGEARDRVARFGRVAVVMGGDSAEREVSLASGEQVLGALLRAGVDAHPIDKHADVLDRIVAGGFARVFLILHGRGGEDGTIQGALDTIGIPYTGSGVLGSALAMDKHRAKAMWRAAGLPTPDAVCMHAERDVAAATALGFPLMVKPVHEGSSIGAARVANDNELRHAWVEARRFDAEVLAERWIEGPEYTIGILGERALPTIRVESTHEIYDYDAKYADGAGTRYIIPCGLDEDTEQRLAELSLEAFEVLGASGWGRVDLLCDAAGDPWLIDVNTAPGMTSHSLVPMAAKAAGISFEALVCAILEETL